MTELSGFDPPADAWELGKAWTCSRGLTGEVVELLQRLHDDGDEGQVELGDVGPDLRVSVAGVCVVAAQQGVDGADGFFMEEENPAGGKTT